MTYKTLYFYYPANIAIEGIATDRGSFVTISINDNEIEVSASAARDIVKAIESAITAIEE